MTSNNVYIWYRINLLSIFFRRQGKHYYLHCNKTVYYILKVLNYQLIKIKLQEHIFDKNKNNFFFEFDFFINIYSKKIYSLFNKNTFNFIKKKFIDRIYLAYIGYDINKNLNLFIRTRESILDRHRKNNIFYIFDDSEFTNFLCNILKKKHKKITFLKNKNYFRKSLFKKVIFLFLTLIFNIFKKSYENIQPKVYQEYIKNIFDRYPDAGHLFWLSKSKISFKDIAWLTFSRNSNNFFNTITKKNEKISSINFFNILKWNHIFKNNFFKFCKNFSLKNRKYFHFYLLEFYIKYKIEHNKKFIEQNNVKILHIYQEPNFESLTLSYACKVSNCIFVWNHWSVDQHPVYYFKYGFCDILLSWGKWNTSYLNSHNFLYDYIFETGMIAGDHIKSNSKKSKNQKKINIFNNTSDELNFIHSNYQLEEFYKVIFNLVNKNKYKISIKPKGDIYRNLNQEIKLNLKNLIYNNKIKLYSHKTPPSQFGYQDDLYIVWGHNTAGNIAAIQNKNVLYFDNANLKFHPFSKKKFVTKNQNDLNKKIHNFFSKKEKFRLQNYEKKYLNEFSDNKANERAGFIFENIFYLLNQNLPKNKVLDTLRINYQSKYGKNKVIAFKGKLKTVNIWEKQLRKIEQSIKRYKS